MSKLANEIKIIKWIVLLPIIGVILTSFILTNIFVSSRYEVHNNEINKLKQTHTSELKHSIKEKIDNLTLLLNENYENEINRSKHSIRDIVNLGYLNLNLVHKNHFNLSKDEFYSFLNERIGKLRFFENKNGYFFLYDRTDAKVISNAGTPEHVGISFRNIKDIKGTSLFENFEKVFKENKKEGFATWYWNRPGAKQQEEKIGYIKIYEPLNIVIGSALYTNDIKKKISKNSIEFLKKLKYPDGSYIFIINTKGTAILHKNKNIVGVPLNELDEEIQKNVSSIVNKAVKDKSAFIEYQQSKELFDGQIPSKKISYVRYVPVLDWVIGTGVYNDNLNKEINRKQELLEKNLEDDISTIVFASLLVTAVLIVIILILSKRLKNIFQYYSRSLENSNNKLHKLNEELENKVKKQVDTLRQKDSLLNQQSKLAAMGEMLGNIAHQWRQPLSAISTLASGIRVKKEIGEISSEELDKDLKAIVSSTKLLSNTIDDFRNYYSKDKHIKEFKLEGTLNNVLNLISANLSNKEIELIFEVEEVFINSYENELIQVLLNILNNAKDALLEKQTPRYIFITIKKHKNHAIIEVCDNAGGIKEDIISRIFEPYFTTKFKSQGTGIGLYMTKNIIDSNLKGNIEVENRSFSYKNEEFKGALFRIKLPFKI
ncbi:MAG: cache domain-containing protein [Campylobacteraceae bacterium]|nr:cache domain-containing protein [Campylobacteraceae bacterium]